MTSRFKHLVDNMEEYGDKVEKPGQSTGIFNENTNELFVHHWSTDKAVGKKFVLTNGLKKVPQTRNLPKLIPGYDHYKVMFNACDRYNRNFHDKKFCHKTGGKGTPGDFGHCHKFIMACILQNTFAVHLNFRDDTTFTPSFKDNCLELADELFLSAL
jgi:hypothetical protein